MADIDPRLAAALAADDAAEDAGMHADDRTTCYTHQSWAKDCSEHPMHKDPIGFGWSSFRINLT